MADVQEAIRPRVLASTDQQPIFLHAGWRSCGTWLWESLRHGEKVRAYYEPLHEDLGRLNRAALTRFSPGSWDSGHSPGAPYFAEYMPLLRRGVFTEASGVQGYEPRFAFDDFFRDPDNDDVALRLYLQGLLDAARAEGRVPVLKFCRSMGRVPWMCRHFPDALHAVVLRDPVAQWISARTQMQRAKNHYFVVAPFIILARNAAHPLLAEAIARLQVPMPPLLTRDLGILRQVCWHHVRRLSWAERYRGFLALWVASSVSALSTDAMVIDSETLGQSDHVERVLARAAGVRMTVFGTYRSQPGPAWLGTDAEAEDAMRASFAALDFVAAARARLSAAHTRRLARKLAPRFRPAARAPLPPPAPRRAALLRALVYVALARLSYPLRRAHYYLRRYIRARHGAQ